MAGKMMARVRAPELSTKQNIGRGSTLGIPELVRQRSTLL